MVSKNQVLSRCTSVTTLPTLTQKEIYLWKVHKDACCRWPCVYSGWPRYVLALCRQLWKLHASWGWASCLLCSALPPRPLPIPGPLGRSLTASVLWDALSGEDAWWFALSFLLTLYRHFVLWSIWGLWYMYVKWYESCVVRRHTEWSISTETEEEVEGNVRCNVQASSSSRWTLAEKQRPQHVVNCCNRYLDWKQCGRQQVIVCLSRPLRGGGREVAKETFQIPLLGHVGCLGTAAELQ